MCFVKDPNFKKHFVALEDIVCYKVLLNDDSSHNYYAPFIPFMYEVGKVYNEEYYERDVLFLDDGEELRWGVFHSCIDYGSARRLFITVAFQCMELHNPLEPKICRCIIPKGSICWANDTEYASSAIKVLEEVKPFETIELNL